MSGATTTTKPGTRPKTTIIAVAEREFTPRNQINCSGYIKDVAQALGEWLPDEDANHLIEYMEHNPSYIKLGNDDVRASKLAERHYIVVAGWLNPIGHGHLVLITPGRKNGFAVGYWGSLHHASGAGANKGIDYAFTPDERREVQYFATPSSSLVSP